MSGVTPDQSATMDSCRMQSQDAGPDSMNATQQQTDAWDSASAPATELEILEADARVLAAGDDYDQFHFVNPATRNEYTDAEVRELREDQDQRDADNRVLDAGDNYDQMHFINPGTGNEYTDAEVRKIKDQAEADDRVLAAGDDYDQMHFINPGTRNEYTDAEVRELKARAELESMGRPVFPVGGDEFDVGWDPDFEASRNFDSPKHNSDFSFSPTDENHQNGHLGIDIFAPAGAPVQSSSDGVVVQIGDENDGTAGGNRVWIAYEQDDGSTVYHYYAHLDEHASELEVGDTVEAGEQIGTVGNTGSASRGEPVLHYAVFEGSQGPVYSAEYAVDPFEQLEMSVTENGELAIA